MKNKEINQFRVLKSGDYTQQHWRNGKGFTRQIAIEPPDADFGNADFLYRLSSAEIRTNGDFSLFPGYDRILVLLAGHGISLSMETKDFSRLLKTREVLRFSGSVATHCDLLDGPVKDFNVFYRADQMQATADVIAFDQERELFWSPRRGWNFLFAVDGQCEFDTQVVFAGETVVLGATHEAVSLASETARSFLLKGQSAESWLLEINLAPTS